MSAPLAFYRGKRVLVTGHTGFKGSWLTLWLHRLGAEVHGVSLSPEDDPNMFELCEVASHCASSTLADIREPGVVADAVEGCRPWIVFHLAAQSLVRRSYRDAPGTWETNVLGTLRVLEACRDREGLQAVVCVTTDKCYENRGTERPFTEDDPLGGHDPYSASKAACELLVASHRRSFFSGAGGTQVATARAGNVIGGGDWAEDRLVPDLIRAATGEGVVELRNPTSTRPWQHVLDPLHGYLLLARRLCAGAGADRAWNFGPDGSQTVDVLARRLCEALGRGRVRHAPASNQPHEATALELDSTRARARLGWSPRLSLETSVDLTAAWYRAWLDDPASLGGLSGRQIDRYMESGAP